MKSKKKIAIITVCSFFGIVLLYALVCCGLTFIPIWKMGKINSVACGSGNEPAETIVLENDVKLYHFPSGGIKDKYVIVCPGGGYTGCAVETEGYPVATELNKLGYTAFVLEYRVGEAITTTKAPLDDLANAIKYVDQNAKKYNVYAGLYVLCGFSAGGNLIGLFGTEEFGYGHYSGVKAPNALIMGYPWCNPNVDFKGNFVDTIVYATLNKTGSEAFLGEGVSLDEMRVPVWVTDEYPRTYIMHGEADVVVPIETHSDILVKALEENGIDHRYKKCKGVPHGCGLGIGTTAEGWLAEAMEFANEKWYDEDYEPDPVDCEGLKAKVGGYMCGVCHPDWKCEEARELGAEWVRVDIGFPPLDENNEENFYYKLVRDYTKTYVEQGFKVMVVTPLPKDFIAVGLDPRKKEDIPRIMEQLRYFITDLQGIASAIQVMNELTEPQFREPLTMEESAEFLTMALKVMNRYKGNIVVGYNLSATEFAKFIGMMQGQHKYADFIGIDFYLGCFEKLTSNLGFATAKGFLKIVRNQTNRPIVVTEFGYLSAGERMPDEDKLDLLHSYGAQGETVAEAEAYAKAHIRSFITNENFPIRLRERLETICNSDEEIAVMLFGGPNVTISYAAHLYMELEEGVVLNGYPHTPEGQADYFTDCFEAAILPCEYLCGSFVYCFNDSAACYVCGQERCPVETGWGLLDGNGEKKPSFYAVQEAFIKCKENK